MLSKHSVDTYQGSELTCNSSGNAHPLSSQLAEPLWTDPGPKSGITVCELISTLKNKYKKRRLGMNCLTFFQNPRTRGKRHHHQRSNEHSLITPFDGTQHVTISERAP